MKRQSPLVNWLTPHRRTAGPVKFTCSICELRFRDAMSLIGHGQSVHRRRAE